VKTVLANGCFDVLHVGHLWHLKEAKQLGDWLVVALTVDEAVHKGPGLPINAWEHRAEMLQALRYVDLVVPSTSCHDAILQIRPDIFVKGCDYEDSTLLNPAREACARVGATLHLTHSPKLSSGAIIQRMLKSLV
jgi:rfaE bifunctional protein nucleotidyltransferase chain/domain